MIYGYCRISTKSQNIERQVRNIREVYPEVCIVKETFTGTKVQGRVELDKILKVIGPGDSIVFDSVSRMSRNADEGVALYEDLYNQGVNLVFLKEKHINTSVYKEALENQIEMTGNEIADEYIKATNKVLMILAKKQVELAFEQAQKEVDDLQQRTKEGMRTARLNGKQIGQVKGKKLVIKKKEPMKEKIRQYSKDFDGTLNDGEVMTLTGLSRNTYYKYKKEIKDTLMISMVQ